ncbi:uncharacterized protein LOC105830129 isoform X2 [Monomorium pharaonis]|nr:uncharacterized protein LOC105830129 isoform X2 [Monomorium pharaonis]
MSDDIELNVDTLKPEEKEDEKAVSGEESSYGQRILMRKPATFVQYWINTGNLPYKALLNEKNELSETGSSLSEKEITSLVSPSASPVTNVVHTVNNATDDKQKCKNDSSCSSVDTAAYILSNANITKMDTFHEKQILENVISEIIAKDTSMTTLHRKKLYTGRDSPIDIILTETHGTNRLSQQQTKQSLHPAFDLDDTIKRKTTSIHEDVSKHSSIKKNFVSKKVKRKEVREFDCSKITDISNKYEYINNKIKDSNIDGSFKNLSDSHNNLDKQDDRTFRKYDDTISIKSEKYKQYLSSLNLNPVVLLQRIEHSIEQHKFTERQSRNQVFNRADSDSAFQKKTFRNNNRNKLCQDRNKYSILTFTSSDEDDFVRSIQHPRKRLKVSINESKKIVQKDIRSIKENKEHNKVVEIRSFDSDTQTATTSLQPHENERFMFFSSEDDNDDATDNLDKNKKRISSFDSKKIINYNSKRHSNEALKKTGVDHKDIHVIFFQTKTYDTNSSDSEESNSYTLCTYHNSYSNLVNSCK